MMMVIHTEGNVALGPWVKNINLYTKTTETKTVLGDLFPM